MSTYGTMIDRIAAELERSDLGSSSSPGVIGDHINDAIRLHKAEKWWFLQGPTSAALTSTTTVGNSYVARYSGLIQLDSLRVTVSGGLQRLRPIAFDEMESLHDGTTSTGEPYCYCDYGERLRLYPTPGSAYTLTWSGLFEEPALSASADTNDWMTKGELLIRHTARMTILRDYIRDTEGAQLCLAGMEMGRRALDQEHFRRMNTRSLTARM